MDKRFTLIPISMKTVAQIIRNWESHTDKGVSRNHFLRIIKKTSILVQCLLCFEMLYMTSQLHTFSFVHLTWTGKLFFLISIWMWLILCSCER